MKIVFLILTIFFLFIGCGQEENEEDVFTALATVYYYGGDPGFGGYKCSFFFKTENENFYTVDNLDRLDDELKQGGIEFKISFIKTNRIIDCSLWDTLNTTVVQIKAFEKL